MNHKKLPTSERCTYYQTNIKRCTLFQLFLTALLALLKFYNFLDNEVKPNIQEGLPCINNSNNLMLKYLKEIPKMHCFYSHGYSKCRRFIF